MSEPDGGLESVREGLARVELYGRAEEEGSARDDQSGDGAEDDGAEGLEQQAEEDMSSEAGDDAVVQGFMMDEEARSDSKEMGPGGKAHSGEADLDREEGKRVIARFLHECTCYDIVPESSKVVVFDRNIPIRLSYYALVEHEIGAAPLWDPVTQRLSGIITTLDFIEMLRYGHHTKAVLEILDSHSVASWRSLVTQLCESPEMAASLTEAGMPAVEAAAMAAEFEQTRPNSTYTHPERATRSVSTDCSLYEACRALQRNGVHWLPVIDPADEICLGVITHLAMLQYLVTNFVEERRLFEQPIASLNIGTLPGQGKTLVTATLTTPVHEILDMLSTHCVSCVPILGGEGKPIAAYARTNVIDLVTHNSVENSLDLSLGELIFGEAYDAERSVTEMEIPERMRMHCCKVSDTLQQVFIKFAEVRVHRLLYVDEEGFLQGIVSLSDLLSYFVD